MGDTSSTEEACGHQTPPKSNGVVKWIVVFVVTLAGFASDVATIMESVLKITRYFGHTI